MKKIKTNKYEKISKQSQTKRWESSPGQYTIELILDDGRLYDVTNDTDVPESVQMLVTRSIPTHALQGSSIEMEINFSSKGYDTPASMYGGPDQLGYPEEGDEERIVDSVNILIDGNPVLDLPSDMLM